MKPVLALFLLLFSAASSYSQQCVSGDPKRDGMVAQMNEAKKSSPLTQLIYQSYNLEKSNTEGSYCQFCTPDNRAQSASGLTPIEVTKNPRAPTLLFKSECLQVSNSFKSGTSQFTCTKQPDGTYKRTKSNDMCMTSNMLDYQNAVISNFISCAISLGYTHPDPATMFSMYALETGFKPQYSSVNGVGMGQLTTNFVNDIHQRGRGEPMLRKITMSTNPECQGARMIASKDLGNKPKLRPNTCPYTVLGEGMERNVLYSIIGFNTKWQYDLEPTLRSYIKKYPNDPKIDDVINLAVVNSYGPGGHAAAKTAARRLSRKHTPEQFVAAMKKPMLVSSGSPKNPSTQNLTVYTSGIAKRERDLGNRLPGSLKTEFATKGSAACVNPY